MTTKITGDNISSIANTGVTWNAVTVADGSTQLSASAGNGYFLDTNTGVIEVLLPTSPTRGDTVILVDYGGNFATNNVIVNPGGSNIIDSVATAGFGQGYTLSTNNLIVELVYVDSTKGWLSKENESKSDLTAASDTNTAFIEATGGTVLTVGDFKTHVFTGDGCFSVSALGRSQPYATAVDYLVVAGGGGSGIGGNGSQGEDGGGGGGAGGFRVHIACTSCGPTNPLNAPAKLTVSVADIPVTVGGGGAQAPNNCTPGSQGSNSVFSTITSAGGGFGGSKNHPTAAGGNGGSGGGGGTDTSQVGAGGSGNTPPVSPSQGNNGATASCGTPSTNKTNSGGGGGAGAAGSSGGSGGNTLAGGIGSFVPNDFLGPTAPSYGEAGPVCNVRYFAGGGGGATGETSNSNPGGPGGAGGGGNGAAFPDDSGNNGQEAGAANTGGGAGGAGSARASGAGGKGIVLIRYKFQ